MMEAVVSYGTGTSAASRASRSPARPAPRRSAPGRPSDAWFIAFAPAEAPRIAIAVLIVNGGVGGDVAAPIARQVLETALARMSAAAARRARHGGVLHVDWQRDRRVGGGGRAADAAGVGSSVLTNTTGRTRAGIAASRGDGDAHPGRADRDGGVAAAEHLAPAPPGARVHALVEPAIAGELEGVELVDDPAAAEVTSWRPRRRWTYPRLNAVFRRLVDGVPLVAMQRNRWWPTVDGPSLDAGAFVAGLEYATGSRPPSWESRPRESSRWPASAPARNRRARRRWSATTSTPTCGPRVRSACASCSCAPARVRPSRQGPGDVDLDVADLAAAVDLLLR